MSLFELFLLSIGLAMDAFAVAISIGLSNKKIGVSQGIIASLYFGLFQAGMPAIGFVLARFFADYIISYDHWVAFVLLSYLGGKMVWSGFSRDEKENRVVSFTPAYMLPLAIATSIDALAVGVSFAFLKVNIVFAGLLIGIITFVISFVGVKIGSVCNDGLKNKAELFGGIILIIIGLKILVEHLGLFGL